MKKLIVILLIILLLAYVFWPKPVETVTDLEALEVYPYATFGGG